MTGIVLLIVAAAASPLSPDPAPGLFHTKTWSRNLQCERVSAEIGSQRYPGRIVTSSPRGDYVERSAVICRERLTRSGLRSDRDEAILSSLTASVTALASTIDPMREDLKRKTWLVQTYYPGAPVAAKITFATKGALMRRGLAVSDRAPTLAASDIDIITRMPPDDAYPAACRRYFASGSLGESDALLAVVSRDARETLLHAGLCVQGQWTWLR